METLDDSPHMQTNGHDAEQCCDRVEGCESMVASPQKVGAGCSQQVLSAGTPEVLINNKPPVRLCGSVRHCHATLPECCHLICQWLMRSIMRGKGMTHYRHPLGVPCFSWQNMLWQNC